MTLEIEMLAWACLLAIAHIIVASHLQAFQRGYWWVAGSREGDVAPLTGHANRAMRSLQNFLETFPVFVALVLAAHLVGRHDLLTVWGVQLYFWARLFYIVLYGIPVVRSVVWNVATVGLLMIAVALLWNPMA